LTVLVASGVGVEIAGRLVVSEATFTVRAHDKVGLVGRNGAGKTSLLRVLSGIAPPVRGTVRVSGGIGYLPQDPRIAGVLDGRTAVSHILSGRGFDEELTRIEKLRLQMEEDPNELAIARYSRAEERFRADGGYSAESEVRSITAGLGLAPDRVDLSLGVLSGGERRRVELARILFAGSDVLLLDEPTNHLDADAKAWLMKFFRSYRGALVVVSHDLDLLDEAITRVLHLDRSGEEGTGALVEYRGTYSEYRAARARDEVRLAKLAIAQEKEIARLQRFVDRFGAKASKASLAHSIEKRIARIESDRVDAPKAERSINVRFPEPPHSGRVVLEVAQLSKGYGGPPVFQGITFDVARGERLLVLGLNGAGKTSLLRILAGETEADSGAIHFGHQVSAGYYAQEHDGLVPEWSLLEHLSQQAGLEETTLRALLGMFGLTGEKAHQDAGSLSGGEKTKLALAQLVAGRHNLVLLDEPTNNLDPPSRDAVANALARWPGSMVVVTHDPDFVARLAPQRVLMMPDGDVDYWTDDFADLVALA
jgi:ATPase subunit of ABC transporter with duplicated ATPase domains